MYFPHAFRKSFLPAVSGGAVSLLTDTSKTTADLTAGQMGFVNAKTWSILSAGANVPFILAQGNYFTSDTMATTMHGGYKESLKSKMINPKYVSRLFKVTAKSPKNQIIKIDALGCAITCDTTYRLRLDLKGSPALRTVTHNLYKVLDAYSGCCNDTNDDVDVNVILLQWKDQINNDPILSKFVQAALFNQTYAAVAIDPTVSSATIKVANADKTKFVAGNKVVAAGIPETARVVSIGANDSGGSGFANVVLTEAATSSTNVNADVFGSIATDTYTPVTGSGVAAVEGHIELTVAYVDTKFGDCTFTVSDNYDLEPLFMYASFVEDSGDHCTVICFTTSEVQAPVQASGVGETVIRDMILSGRYMQEVYPDGYTTDVLRMREIEANPGVATVNRSGLYDQVMILHNVPRFNNPTSTFDNDQYLLVIHVPTGTTTTAITTFITDSCTAAGNPVTLEQI